MKNYCQMHSYCVIFAPKLKVVILVLGYGHFLQENGSHDSSADSSKKCRLTYVYSHFKYSLNLRQKWMPNPNCGKHNKLSKTMGVTIGLNGRNN